MLGVLQGGWLDGREVRVDDRERLIALGSWIGWSEGPIFLSGRGFGVEGNVRTVAYVKTADLDNKGCLIYQYES